MGQFSNYPSATDSDYTTDATFLIQNTDGDTLLANLDDLNKNFFGDIKVVNLTVTTAQILALNSTPIELIAAQGAGKTIEIISASTKLVYVSAAYATNTNLQLLTSGATNAQFDDGKVITATVSTHWKFEALQPTSATDTQLIENAAVNVTVETGDPITGDSNIEIFALYRVLDV